MFEERKRKVSQRSQALTPALTPLIPAKLVPELRTLPEVPNSAPSIKSAAVQRQVALPALRAAALHGQEVQRVEGQITAIQRQLAESPAPQSGSVEAALQRQAAAAVPAKPLLHPQSTADWVTVMRQQAQHA